MAVGDLCCLQDFKPAIAHHNLDRMVEGPAVAFVGITRGGKSTQVTALFPPNFILLHFAKKKLEFNYR